MSLGNHQLSELLANEAPRQQGNAQKALRRASRKALAWHAEASTLAEEGGLRSLDGVGPYVERILLAWLEQEPPVPEPPPIREHFLTYTQVRQTMSEYPGVELSSDLQNHTEYSDGGVTLDELAEAAMQRGYRFIAVTDHSKGLKIAGGMDDETLLEQMRRIDEINDRIGRQVLLRSIEMNISPDGTGDTDPQLLSRLDVVLGSFHSQLRKKEDQTERYVAALNNPDVHILGHPKGRIYNFREGLNADWARVAEEAVRVGKALEIDGFPDRQDMSVPIATLAARAGTYVSIGSDSHYPGQLPFGDYGLAIALRAGVERSKILNLMTLEDLSAWVGGLRERRGTEFVPPA